jgi:predicted deacylase
MRNKDQILLESLYESNVLNKNKIIIISGLHGDEPAGNIAAKFFENLQNVYVISDINSTNKRRMDGRDLNRHFDTPDENDIQDKIILGIEKMNPKLVISLHEDDEVDGVYAYCSPDLEECLKQCLEGIDISVLKNAHGDKTDGGVITNGNQPYKGTLERALRRRNISYCTIETPSSEKSLEERVICLKQIVNNIINYQN